MRTHRGEVSFPGRAARRGRGPAGGGAARGARGGRPRSVPGARWSGWIHPVLTMVSGSLIMPVLATRGRAAAPGGQPGRGGARLRRLAGRAGRPGDLPRGALEDSRADRSPAAPTTRSPCGSSRSSGELIWGATARMIHELLSIVLTGRDRVLSRPAPLRPAEADATARPAGRTPTLELVAGRDGHRRHHRAGDDPVARARAPPRGRRGTTARRPPSSAGSSVSRPSATTSPSLVTVTRDRPGVDAGDLVAEDDAAVADVAGEDRLDVVEGEVEVDQLEGRRQPGDLAAARRPGWPPRPRRRGRSSRPAPRWRRRATPRCRSGSRRRGRSGRSAPGWRAC